MTGNDRVFLNQPLEPHPLRHMLTNEIHARPAMSIEAPARVSHLTMWSGAEGRVNDHAHICRLCEQLGAALPAANANHHVADLGTFRIKWERRTEFSTYLVVRPGVLDKLFDEPALTALPQEWLAELPGKLVTGVHISIASARHAMPGREDLVTLFGDDRIVGTQLFDGKASAWTDFLVHGDGFGRLLLHDRELPPQSVGWIVQWLTEIDAYRMMALLALPMARTVVSQVDAMENRLVAITRRLTELADASTEEEVLLDQLTRLAAEIEQQSGESTYRFGAARAYYALVLRRLSELRQSRLEETQTFAEFLDRRLNPAMQTCETAAERLEALSVRVERAANLLRTRVDIALEAQNRSLLESMDRRAELQIRLQHTVEGLSVAAISYYSIGLLSYVFKGLDKSAFPLPVSPDLATGLATPIVIAVVWLGTRRLIHQLTKEEG